MKKNIPNICPHSGISYDYRLAFGNLTNYLERISEGDPARTRHLAKRTFLHRRIPKYEEYFDSQEYDNVINDQNRAVVELINEVVEKLNASRTQGVTDFKTLHSFKEKLLALINGNRM